MKWAIKDDRGNYIARDATNRYYLTADENKKLTGSDYIKMKHIVENRPKAMREKQFQIIPLDNERKISSEDYFPVYKSEIKYEKVKNLLDELEITGISILQEEEALKKEISDIDKELQDILHFIEFKKFSASKGYMLAKMQKELRIRRREIKDKLLFIGIIKQQCNDVLNGHTSHCIEGLDEREYTPRIFPELFSGKELYYGSPSDNQ